jgi:hypothetical protein
VLSSKHGWHTGHHGGGVPLFFSVLPGKCPDILINEITSYLTADLSDSEFYSGKIKLSL